MKKMIRTSTLFVSMLALASCGGGAVTPAASSETAASASISISKVSSVETPSAERTAFAALLTSFNAKCADASFVFPKNFAESLHYKNTAGNDVITLKAIDVSSDKIYAHFTSTVDQVMNAESYAYIKEESSTFNFYIVDVLSSTEGKSKTYKMTSYPTLAEAKAAADASENNAYTSALTRYKLNSGTEKFFKVAAHLVSSLTNVKSETYTGTLESGVATGEITYVSSESQLFGKEAYLQIGVKDSLPQSLSNRKADKDSPYDYSYAWDSFEMTYPDLTSYTKL